MKKSFCVSILLILLLTPIFVSAEESNNFTSLSQQQKNWIVANYSSFGDDALLFYCNWATSAHNGYLISKSSYTGGNVGAVVRIASDGSTTSASLSWSESNLYSNNDIYLINTSSHQYDTFTCGDGLTFNFETFACEVPNPNLNYTISTFVSPSGSGSVSGGGTYESGSNVTLTATANDGYRFVSWNNGLTDNPITITVNSNMSYTAYFELIEEPTPPTPPSSNNLILQSITYSNPKVSFEIRDTGSTSKTTLFYDVTITYYGVGLDIYYSLNDLSSLIQSNIDKFSYTYTDSKFITCTSNAPCNIPSLPSNRYFLASSFTSDDYTILSTSDSGAIEVINPSLDNLICNGNTTSQNAQNSNNQSNSNLDNTLNNFENIENQYNQNINDQLEQIDLNFDTNNFGANFLTSAEWFTAQFDNIVTDSPISSFITFILVVGVGMLLIGRFFL